MNHSGEIFKRKIGLDELYARVGLYSTALGKGGHFGRKLFFIPCKLHPAS